MKRLWVSTALAIGVVLCGTALGASQSKSIVDLGAGKLLVSAKELPDPTFAKSVVLLFQYDQNGAAGLMIDRRTEVPISRVFKDLDTAKHASDPIYLGGPVEMQAILGLLRSQDKPDETTSVLREVYLVSRKTPLEKALTAASGGNEVRVYLGYCGWAGGQLENEVKLGGWWIFDGSAGLVFDPNPGSVWGRLIARTEQQIAELKPAVGVRRQGSIP
jgi:putative transcriptional regulator